MKTIALKEKTFELIRDIKEREKISSFDELIRRILLKKEHIEDSMFGSLKGKTKRFTKKERGEIVGNDERWQ